MKWLVAQLRVVLASRLQAALVGLLTGLLALPVAQEVGLVADPLEAPQFASCLNSLAVSPKDRPTFNP